MNWKAIRLKNDVPLVHLLISISIGLEYAYSWTTGKNAISRNVFELMATILSG